MEEVEDEPLFCERVAGIDIGKKMIMVTIRVPSDTRKGGRAQETREFGTTRKELLALADWLRCWQVEKVGMESTSDYWKPVYFLLEREGFDCTLYRASQVKALPGRPKTDKLDSAWLARITERGSLAGSFVPPEDIRRLRTHTRYRRKLVQMRTAQKERCEKLLEDGHFSELWRSCSGLPETGGRPLSVGVEDCLDEQCGVARVDAGGGIAKVYWQAVAEACCQAEDSFFPAGTWQAAFIERGDRCGPVDAGQSGVARAGAAVREPVLEVAAGEPGGLVDEQVAGGFVGIDSAGPGAQQPGQRRFGDRLRIRRRHGSS